jgi:hypothetical protein
MARPHRLAAFDPSRRRYPSGYVANEQLVEVTGDRTANPDRFADTM